VKRKWNIGVRRDTKGGSIRDMKLRLTGQIVQGHEEVAKVVKNSEKEKR
jgi:hypothetical protein